MTPSRQLLLPFLVLLGTLRAMGVQECQYSVPATITNVKTGMFVLGITPENLIGRIKNAAFPIGQVERINKFRVLLLVDSSGSMSSDKDYKLTYKQKTVQEVRAAAEKEMSSAPEGVQLGFGIFNEKASFSGRFTGNPGELPQMISEATARLKRPGYGETALYDAISQATDQFGAVRQGDSIVLLTDGGDSESRIKKNELAKKLSRKGIRVFVLLVTYSPEADSLKQPFRFAIGTSRLTAGVSPEERDADVMREFAERTGGGVLVIDASHPQWIRKKQSTERKAALDLFWREDVLSAYLLHFSVPNITKEDKAWHLIVKPNSLSRDVILSTPFHLTSCSVATALR